MEYRIEMSDAALADVEKSYLFYKQYSEETANIWFKGLVEVINSLKVFPNRCPIASEARSFFVEIRQLIYGKGSKQHKILFGVSIDEKTGENIVTIYRVRHSFQNYLKDLEFLGIEDEE